MSDRVFYQVNASDLNAFVLFFDKMKSEISKIFLQKYKKSLCSEMVFSIDDHHMGLIVKSPQKNPFNEAVKNIQICFEKTYSSPVSKVDFDFEAKFYFFNDNIFMSFDYGNVQYGSFLDGSGDITKIYETFDGFRSFNDKVLTGENLSCGLSYHLVDNAFPKLNARSVLEYMPNFDRRIRRSAKMYCWYNHMKSNSLQDSNNKKQFGDWLRTRDGVSAYDFARKLAISTLKKTFSEDEIKRYGIVTKKKSVLERDATPPKSIESADIYEGSDGQVFVVVWDAGLISNDRVQVQLADHQVTFIQNGIHYGTISEVPSAAFDLLSHVPEVFIVEIKKIGDTKVVKSKHVGLIVNTSYSNVVDHVLSKYSKRSSGQISGDVS